MLRRAKKGVVAMMQRQLTSSAAKAVAARRASRAREDHLKLTIVPDSEEKGGDDDGEKQRRADASSGERSGSRLELGGIDVVKTWCVQSGNWTSAPARVVRAQASRGWCGAYPKYSHIGFRFHYCVGYRGLGCGPWQRGTRAQVPSSHGRIWQLEIIASLFLLPPRIIPHCF